MTDPAPPRRTDRGGTTLAGWVFSLTFHAAVALGALLFLRQITPAPESDLFTWDVAVITRHQPPETKPSPESAPISQDTLAPPAMKPFAAPPVSSPHPLPNQDPSTGSPSLPQTAESPSQSLTPLHAETVSPVPPIKPDQSIIAESSPPIVSPTDDGHTSAPSASLDQTQPTHPSSTQNAPRDPPENGIEAPASKPPEQTAPYASLQPSSHAALARQDFGWLTETILKKIERLKRYPAEARLDRAEGKVVVKVVIYENGQVSDIEVVKSSGFSSLDQAAVEVLRQAEPFHLPRPLGRPTLTLRIPINYSMDHR